MASSLESSNSSKERFSSWISRDAALSSLLVGIENLGEPVRGLGLDLIGAALRGRFPFRAARRARSSSSSIISSRPAMAMEDACWAAR